MNSEVSYPFWLPNAASVAFLAGSSQQIGTKRSLRSSRAIPNTTSMLKALMPTAIHFRILFRFPPLRFASNGRKGSGEGWLRNGGCGRALKMLAPGL